MLKEEMTPKQRILNSLKGEETDRLAWSPFLAYFWDMQPLDVQEKGQILFCERVGADPMMRGYAKLCKVEYKKSVVNEIIKGKEKLVTYDTPVGILKEKHVFTQNTNSWFLTEHAIKNEEDFKILSYLYDDMILIPDFAKFDEEYKEIGDRALCIPVIGGPRMKTAFQSLVEHWVGTEELVYAISDFPELVEETISHIEKINIEYARISAMSSAEAFIFWEDSSTTNISPKYFEDYSMPEIIKYADIIHNHDKILIHHACGYIKDLVPLMAKTGIDSIESVSSPPTGNIMPWEVKDMIPDNISIVGGIEPTFLLNSSVEELEEYTYTLIRKMGRKGFILANADSCPPDVEIEKFKLISDIVRKK